MANPLKKVGELAPDFKLRAVVTNPEIKRLDVQLSDWRGSQNVVLAFHPFAFTATCDRQIPAMQAAYSEFEGLNTQILAISCDPVASKEAWGKWLGGISFPLVADFWPHGEMCKTYGVFNEEFGRPDRSTFIVDRSGIIRWARVYKPGESPDTAEVLQSLTDIEKGQIKT